MNKHFKFRAKQNPFNSVFWIPLLALLIITLLSQRIKVETPVIPLKFYHHQLDYFDHRNALITYWDNVYSQTFHFYFMAMILCPICALIGNMFNFHDPNNQVTDFMFRPWSYSFDMTLVLMVLVGLTAVIALSYKSSTSITSASKNAS